MPHSRLASASLPPGERARPAPAPVPAAWRGEDRLRRVTRLFHIAAALQAGQAPALGELARQCACSTKTIQRDLTYLSELGVAYRFDARRKGFVLQGRLPFAILDLTLAELTALALGASVLSSPTSPLTPRALASGLRKLEGSAPPEVAEQLSLARTSLLAQAGSGRDYSRAPFYPLLRACRERTACGAGP